MKFSKIEKLTAYKLQSKKNSHVLNTAKGGSMEFLSKLGKKIESARNYDEFYDIFEDLEKQDIGNFVNSTVYKINEMFIFIGLDKDADYYKDLFSRLNKEQISLAPKFVKAIKSDSGFSATFTQIPNTNSEKLKDFQVHYNLVSQKNKETAYTDVQKLLKLGLFNNKIITRNAFELTPISHNIVITDWSSVTQVSSQEDKLKLLEIARKILFREK